MSSCSPCPPPPGLFESIFAQIWALLRLGFWVPFLLSFMVFFAWGTFLSCQSYWLGPKGMGTPLPLQLYDSIKASLPDCSRGKKQPPGASSPSPAQEKSPQQPAQPQPPQPPQPQEPPPQPNYDPGPPPGPPMRMDTPPSPPHFTAPEYFPFPPCSPPPFPPPHMPYMDCFTPSPTDTVVYYNMQPPPWTMGSDIARV